MRSTLFAAAFAGLTLFGGLTACADPRAAQDLAQANAFLASNAKAEGVMPTWTKAKGWRLGASRARMFPSPAVAI